MNNYILAANIHSLRRNGYFTIANESMIRGILDELPKPECDEVRWVAGVGREAAEIYVYMPKARDMILSWIERDAAGAEARLIRYQRALCRVQGLPLNVGNPRTDTERLDLLLSTSKLYGAGALAGYILENREQVDRYISQELEEPKGFLKPGGPGHGEDANYYYLGTGDVICEGDESDSRDSIGWAPVPHRMVGRRASDPRYTPHVHYRRKKHDIDQNAAEKEKTAGQEELCPGGEGRGTGEAVREDDPAQTGGS